MLFVFDIDGTLLHSGGAGSRALDRAFSECFAVESAMADVHPDGKTDPLIVAEIFSRRLNRAPAVDEVESLLLRYVEWLAFELQDVDNYRLLPGVPSVLDELAAEGCLCLATGNVEPGARLKLARGRIERYFEHDGALLGGFGSDSGDRATLTRLAVERGRARFGRDVSNQETYVIGDTPRDVAAARACRATAVAVCTGSYARSALMASGADIVLDDLRDLPASVGLARPPGAAFTGRKVAHP